MVPAIGESFFSLSPKQQYVVSTVDLVPWKRSGQQAADMFIDCHCHLTSERFQDDLEAILSCLR